MNLEKSAKVGISQHSSLPLLLHIPNSLLKCLNPVIDKAFYKKFCNSWLSSQQTSFDFLYKLKINLATNHFFLCLMPNSKYKMAYIYIYITFFKGSRRTPFYDIWTSTENMKLFIFLHKFCHIFKTCTQKQRHYTLEKYQQSI